jgi:hypothetical protein
MNLEDIRVYKDMQKDNEFSLSAGSQTLTFVCENKSEADAWQAAVKKTKLTSSKDKKTTGK